jgi:post-segregation antitoxin (ccd killing protein)
LGGGWVVTSVVLSVRVRRELKEEAERLGINIREVVERALEEEIRRVKMERLKMVIGEALKAMDVGVEEWVEAIRESRLER